MVLQYSGTISMGNIEAEFGGSRNMGSYRTNATPNFVEESGLPAVGSPISFGNFYGKGKTGYSASFPASRAKVIQSRTLGAVPPDGVFWILCNFVAVQIYCLMNTKWDGGGWMMLLKASPGTTFGYNSSYWTSSDTTLNTGSYDRSNANAKFETYNHTTVKDVMALWPDLTFPNVGGSITTQSECWSWLSNDWYNSGSYIRPVLGFGSALARDVPGYNAGNVLSFPGFNANYFSYQDGARRFVFGGSAFTGLGNSRPVRWGFCWNNEGDFNSNDAGGGIGNDWLNRSAGDLYYCCGVVAPYGNREMRVELYGR